MARKLAPKDLKRGVEGFLGLVFQIDIGTSVLGLQKFVPSLRTREVQLNDEFLS